MNLIEFQRIWANPPAFLSERAAAQSQFSDLYALFDWPRPGWLAHLLAALDRALWAAYGWADDPAETMDERILERLLALNGERSR